MWWLVFALITGVFVTLAIVAFVNGYYNFVAAFLLVAGMYAALGIRELRNRP